MSSYFADSSALVKRYMPEVGTRWVRAITTQRGGHTLIIAHITLAEMISAIARHYHDGKIALSILQAFRHQLEFHARSQYQILALTPLIVSQALDLHEKYRLRAYDSVQLASAMIVNQRAVSIGQTITFLSADTRLLQAAISEGLSVDDPNQHP